MVRTGRAGQAGLMVAMSLTVMFGVLGFVVDFGLGEFKKHAAQAAADAAALAAAAYAASNGSSCASGIVCGVVTNCTVPGSATKPFDAGCLYANANGYSNGGKGGTQVVTMLANNTSSPVAGNNPNLWFQATIGESYATLFGRFGGVGTFSIQAQAVAALSSAGGTYCVYALAPSGAAFTDSGSGNVNDTGCGIFVNGNFSYSGSGNVTAQTIQYGGSYTYSGSGTISPAPSKAGAQVSDPFSGLTAPTVSSTCDHTGFSISDASAHTLSPGEYCGGLQLSGSGNLTFSSGTYILNGTDAGGRSFDYSGSGNLSGTNVTFFITGKNGYTAGPVAISGSGNLTFSAPASGSYQGLLFYQDPGVSYAGTNSYSGSGNVTGTFYFPTTSLAYSGSGNNAYAAIVANRITMSGSGNASFQKDLTGQYTGLVRTTSSLIQ